MKTMIGKCQLVKSFEEGIELHHRPLASRHRKYTKDCLTTKREKDQANQVN
jgi:hypothetical protein